MDDRDVYYDGETERCRAFEDGTEVRAVEETETWIKIADYGGRWLPKKVLKPKSGKPAKEEVPLNDTPTMARMREEWVTKEGEFSDVEYVSVEHGHEILQDGVTIWDVPGCVLLRSFCLQAVAIRLTLLSLQSESRRGAR